MTETGAGTVRVVLPGMLRDLTDGVGDIDTPVDANGVDLATVLDRALEPWPRVQSRVRDERGEIRRHVNVFVDGEDARRGDGLATTVRPGSVVHVINAVSGG
ncbi:MAG: MoaD/ThiS family protein [Lapillicoccus sp.]